MKKVKGKSMVITMGDPAGCGPQVVFAALKSLPRLPEETYVVGDKLISEQLPQYQQVIERIFFVDVSTPGIKKIKKGMPSELSGRTSLAYLDKALEIMENKNILRLVTAPVSQEAIKLVRPEFRGHTEFLGQYFAVSKIAMLMLSPKLKTVLLTRHIPLARAGAVINPKLIRDTISLVYSFLHEKLGVRRPAIALASFNPHAGIDTFLLEEEKIMKKAAADFSGVFGPYPADSLFSQSSLEKFDCIISAYHDQGMIPFKLLSFRSGVNVTIGLPVIRTSPAHGVAYGLVRNNPREIFSSSMKAAIEQALRLPA